MNDRARQPSNLVSGDDATTSDPRQRASGARLRAERIPSSPPPAPVLAQHESAQLSIVMPTSEALLEPTYAYLSAYCFAVFGPSVAQRLNVAVYELFANALRHGSETGEVRLELRRRGSAVLLLVTNRASESQLDRLREHLERVQCGPSAAYQREMSRFEIPGQPSPMLGLVRVAHEAGLAIRLHVDEDWVEVSTLCG